MNIEEISNVEVELKSPEPFSMAEQLYSPTNQISKAEKRYSRDRNHGGIGSTEVYTTVELHDENRNSYAYQS